MLVVTCMVFVPLYAAVRLTMERNDSNIDLLFITTIAPAAIIRGKFWSAVALTALIYSASMPFLTFTYLLRGIDLPSIFFALGTAFVLTTVLIMLAIFVGSVPGGLLLRILLGGGLLWVGAAIMFYTVAFGLVDRSAGAGVDVHRPRSMGQPSAPWHWLDWASGDFSICWPLRRSAPARRIGCFRSECS